MFYTKHQNLKTKMCPGTVDAILKKYARQIHEKTPDFPLNLHAHMLRHSIAMAMYKNGVLVLCQEKVPVKMRNMHSYTQLPVHCIDFFL